MCDDYRAMLDELFGKERNVPQEKRKNDAHYWDDNVCKNGLVSICFNDLWKHTKYDAEGECMKRHDQIFKTEFKNDVSKKKLQREKKYVEDAINYIVSKTREVDKIIKKHEQQLEEHTQMEIDRPKDIQTRIDSMEMQMKQCLQESERLGEMGKLEESEQKAQEAENIKKARDDVILVWDAQKNPFKTYKICEVCGAKMSLHETENRVRMHIDGKIHQGFQTVRQELDKLERRKNDIERELENELDKSESKSLSESSLDRFKISREESRKEKERYRDGLMIIY